MKDHKGCIRGYYRYSKAYYAKPEDRISVMVGMYHPDGGTSGEFEFEWYYLSGSLCARLNSFEDSWSALSKFQDLLDIMADIDSECIQEPEFCEILDKLDIKDLTSYYPEHPSQVRTKSEE